MDIDTWCRAVRAGSRRPGANRHRSVCLDRLRPRLHHDRGEGARDGRVRLQPPGERAQLPGWRSRPTRDDERIVLLLERGSSPFRRGPPCRRSSGRRHAHDLQPNRLRAERSPRHRFPESRLGTSGLPRDDGRRVPSVRHARLGASGARPFDHPDQRCRERRRLGSRPLRRNAARDDAREQHAAGDRRPRELPRVQRGRLGEPRHLESCAVRKPGRGHPRMGSATAVAHDRRAGRHGNPGRRAVGHDDGVGRRPRARA